MTTSTLLARVAMLTLLLSACEPESVATRPPACTEGAEQACACPDGPGVAHCTKQGTFGACECPPAPVVEAAPAPAPEATSPAPAPEPAPAVEAEAVTLITAEPASLTPEPGVYDVTISREGQCLSLSGPRALPATTKKQRWRIAVKSPNTLTIDDGDKKRGATLTNGQYVFDRPSEHGRAMIKLMFAPDGLHGTGTASAVSHRGRNRRTAEDCSETLTITGSRA